MYLINTHNLVCWYVDILTVGFLIRMCLFWEFPILLDFFNVFETLYLNQTFTNYVLRQNFRDKKYKPLHSFTVTSVLFTIKKFIYCVSDLYLQFSIFICQMWLQVWNVMYLIEICSHFFCNFLKKVPRPKWTIFKYISDKNKKGLSVGNFGILFVCRHRHVYSLHKLI